MSTIKSGFAGWYTRVVDFQLESLFSRKRVPGPPRTIYVNEDLPEDYLDHKRRTKPEYIHTTNQVITSKYTIITFVPRNFLEQFRRIANLYVFQLSVVGFCYIASFL